MTFDNWLTPLQILQIEMNEYEHWHTQMMGGGKSVPLFFNSTISKLKKCCKTPDFIFYSKLYKLSHADLVGLMKRRKELNPINIRFVDNLINLFKVTVSFLKQFHCTWKMFHSFISTCAFIWAIADSTWICSQSCWLGSVSGPALGVREDQLLDKVPYMIDGVNYLTQI